MKTEEHWKNKKNCGRISRLTAILLLLIVAMLIIIAIPSWRAFEYRAQKQGCVQALKSARDGLIIEYLGQFREESVEEAMETLDEVMPARADLCPAGGTIYLIKDENGIYAPVCGLHDSDKALKCRLNASRAKDLLEEKLREERRVSETEPESIIFPLNGKELECIRVSEKPNLRRGTSTTNGYKGIVAFYGLAGEGAFAQSPQKSGKIDFFVYADEDYCAIWNYAEQWTGSAYEQFK